MKNPVTPPGINPGTVRLVAQHLNHYATPGPLVGDTPIIFLHILTCIIHGILAEPGFNDFGFCDISSIASDILLLVNP